MIKAFAYLRTSSKTNVDGDSFPRQLAAINKHAAANGIKIAQTFKEEGVSGTVENMNRPAWVEMMATIMSNGVKTIIIEKLDRLARDLLIQEHIIADLLRRGVTLVSVAEPDLCSNDPSRKLMRQIMGAIAEYDKTMIVARLRAARERIKAATGKCEGAPLYGTLPGEAKVRDRILKMRAKKGVTLQSIADALNAEGVKPRRGKIWHAMSVRRVAARKPA